MLVMIDNYDSFVYNLVRYFNELEEEVKVFRKDKISIDELKKKRWMGLLYRLDLKHQKIQKKL